MAQVAELDDRIAKCNKILVENPNSQIFAALSEAYRKKGEVDKAFRICQTGLKSHPEYGSAHMVMAKVNLDKGLLDWAEMEVLKVIELDGHSHASDLLFAEILIEKGEFSRATSLLDKLQNTGANIQQVSHLLKSTKRQPPESQSIAKLPESVQSEKVKQEETDLTVQEQESRPVSPKEITVKELMDTIIDIPGVDGILFINKDGMVADSRWDDSQQVDIYGALSRDVEETIQSQMEISHFGKYENILIETEKSIIKILPLKDNLLLIKANMQINLGTLRLKLSGLISMLNMDFI